MAIALWAGLMLGICAPGSQARAQSGCPTGADDIDTDRPDATNSSYTVPYGSFQMENGVEWTARNQSNVIDGTQTLLRLGVAHCTEFFVQVPEYFYSTGGNAASGFSDTTVGFKRQIEPQPGGFVLSASATLTFPTGSSAISNHGYDPGLQFTWSHDIAYGWSAAGMFTITWFTSQPEQNPTYQPTFEFLRALGDKAQLFFEYAGSYDHQRPSQILDTGATYLLTKRQQIDFITGFGLNSASPSQFFGAGYSFRLDGLF